MLENTTEADIGTVRLYVNATGVTQERQGHKQQYSETSTSLSAVTKIEK
jgi:hypothetical protein